MSVSMYMIKIIMSITSIVNQLFFEIFHLVQFFFTELPVFTAVLVGIMIYRGLRKDKKQKHKDKTQKQPQQPQPEPAELRMPPASKETQTEPARWVIKPEFMPPRMSPALVEPAIFCLPSGTKWHSRRECPALSKRNRAAMGEYTSCDVCVT